jgi:hypothetical protein
MKRLGILTAALAVLVSAGLWADEAAGAAPKKAGDALLDNYVQMFKEMAEGGTGGGPAALEKRLQAWAADARKAREKGEIDLYFLSWYQRILAMTKLFIAPDPGMLLKPVIDRELADFLMDTLGEEPAAGSGPAAIGQVAKALATEIINLQIYLDTLDKRAALTKKLGLAPEALQK